MSDSTTSWLENLDPKTDMLYVTMEDGTFNVIDLVVSSRAKAGAFVRDGGSWFRIPDKDDSTLDDVVVMEVSPDFVELFDRREAQNKKITLDEVRGFPVDEAMSAAAAPKKDQVRGSDKNKPGSASGGKKIVFSDKVETALKNKITAHNEKAPAGRKATLGQLKAVYRRGAGAFSSSHRPGMTRDQWAMARVNAYLRLLRTGRPANSKYTQDNDLLPAKHPKSSKKDLAVTAAGDEDCPPATQDIAINLANRENAIKTAAYGPLNPAEPNEEFWKTKGDRWSVTIDDAKKSLCSNCAVFVVTSKMLDCIASGLEQGGSSESDAWDAIDTAELGYCESFDFKCAASRTCDAWVAGGPVVDNVQ